MQLRFVLAVIALLLSANLYAATSNFDIVKANSITAKVINGKVDSSKYASLNAAITAIGSTPTVLEITTANFPLTGNATVPSTLVLKPTYPGSVNQGAYTLTINSPFEAGAYQVFTGSGAVSGLKEARPEWWGNDAAAVESAIAASSLLLIDSDIVLDRAVSAPSGLKIKATATITGDGTFDLFDVGGGSLDVEGGTYSTMRSGFYSNDRLSSVKVRNATFSGGIHGLNFNDEQAGNGSLDITGCYFSDLESGIFSHMYWWDSVFITNNNFTNMLSKTLASRPYPFDKQYVTGVWIISTGGESSVNISNNFVDGVVRATEIGENETHGIGVTIDDGFETDVVIHGNIIKNISGPHTASEGVEGIMGRGKRVVISSNTLLDAGGFEGCIYAKGSTYHKIVNNIVEISSTNPDVGSIRGVISTGSNVDISGNKFVNTFNAIYSRATNSIYRDNEFINCANAAVTMSIESNTTHVLTIFERNKLTAGTRFGITVLTIASGSSYGTFIIRNNMIESKAICNMKAAGTLIVEGNYVNRDVTSVDRELIILGGLIGNIFIRNNTIMSFANANDPSNSRVLTGNTNNSPKIYIEGNYINNGYFGFWLRDMTYVDLVYRQNTFFNCTPVNITSITVTGKNIASDNIGIDL